MDLHVSLTGQVENKLPNGIDGCLFDGPTADRLKTISEAVQRAENSGNKARVKELTAAMSELPFNRLWDIAYQIEKYDENTVWGAEYFDGGRGLLVSDPEWTGEDAMPLQFKDDVSIHIYGNHPELLFEYAKEVLSNTSLNVVFEPVPQINMSLTDKYEINGAADGSILSGSMPAKQLMDTEALRKEIMSTLSEKINAITQTNTIVDSIELNIYAVGPKTATVAAFNAIQLLADSLQEKGISLNAGFMHLDRETGEYFRQKVELACEHKIAPEMPNIRAWAKGNYSEKVDIVLEICDGRHGENPIVTHGAVYGSALSDELMTDPEQVQEDIENYVSGIIESESRQRILTRNFTPVEYTVSDVASGAAMPLVAFLNAMVEQNQSASVYQYDSASHEYFRQEAITVMYKDVIREIGEREREIEHPMPSDDMER